MGKSSLAVLSPRNLPDRRIILLAIKAYFDGTKRDNKAITLACLASDEDTWGAIEQAWEDVRKSRGNPPCIHMTDLMALEEDFENWSGEERDYLVDGLLNVFLFFRGHPRIHSFTCSVHLSAYDRYKADRHLPDPARLCTRIAFPQMVEWYINLPGQELVGPIEVFFDRDEPFLKQVYPAWKNPKIRKRHPGWELIKTIAPVEMQHSPAIQMADVIAWGRNRLESGSDWETDPHYATAVRAANTIRWIHRPWNEEALSKFMYREEGYAAIDPKRLKQKQVYKMSGTSEEFKRFDEMMRQLMRVSHDEVKKKLDEEKQAKKRKKSKKSSASREGA